MPIYLEPMDVTADLENVGSVLIVSCMMCPPMSVAMQQKKPLLDLFKYGFKSKPYDDYVASIRDPLEKRGVRTGVYAKVAPWPFVCLWTEGQRRRLRKRAMDYEAVLVLGCNSALSTVEDVLKGTDCKIIPGMRMKGIVNATTKVRLPFKVDLVMHPKKRRGYKRKDKAGAVEAKEKETS
ncbi:MAG: hypothetical protein P8Z76_17015 [Alphaproteobacteria bacterium]|jgi:hypothetical protein